MTDVSFMQWPLLNICADNLCHSRDPGLPQAVERPGNRPTRLHPTEVHWRMLRSPEGGQATAQEAHLRSLNRPSEAVNGVYSTLHNLLYPELQ